MESGGASDVDKSPRTAIKRTSEGKLVCKIVHNKSHLLGRLNLVKQEPNDELKSNSDTEYTNQEQCVLDHCIVKEEYDDCSGPAESGDNNQQLEQVEHEATTSSSPWGLGRFSSNIRLRFTNNLALFKATFPMKLWELVGDSKISMVTWSACGGAILLDTRVFDEKIQDLFPGEFGDNKLRNFCRQLRVYDFNVVNNKDPNWPLFVSLLSMAPYIRVHYHHFFRRGHPVDLCNIARVRDVIPRGCRKPKNPRPRPAESLLAPTGPYYIGQPPEVLLEKVNNKVQHDHSQSESVGESESQSVREVQSTEVLSACSVSGSKSCASAGELASFCGSLRLNPLPDTESSPTTSDEDAVLSSRGSATLTAGKVTAAATPTIPAHQTQLKLTDEASSSSLDDNFAVTFSELVADAENTQGHIVRSQKDQGHSVHNPNHQGQKGHSLNGKAQTVKTSYLQADAAHLHRPSVPLNQQVPGENIKSRPTSSLVLVPCLRTQNSLLPLTYGSRLSAAGIDFLRECPDFKLFLNQLNLTRPTTTDRSQQCNPIPTNDGLDCDDDSNVRDVHQCDDDNVPTKTEADDESDNKLSDAKTDGITRKNDEVIDENNLNRKNSNESQVTTDSNNSVRDVFLGYVENTAVDMRAECTSTTECIQEGGDDKEGVEGDSDHSMDKNYTLTSPDESASIDWSWDEDTTIKPIVIAPVKEELNV